MRRLGYAQGQDRGGGGRARTRGRGALRGRDRRPARGRAAPGRAAGRQARQAQGLSRGRPAWLRFAPADHRTWPRLHGGGALAGPAPRKPGDRVKTNRRDAVTLARLHRAGELTAAWIPDPVHEAMRDLVRARQQLQGFLLRHERVFTGRKTWSPAHRRWLAGLRFAHPAQQIVLQEQIDTIEEAERRRDRLGQQIRDLVPGWSMAPVVAALQAMRGVAFLSAVGAAAGG